MVLGRSKELLEKTTRTRSGTFVLQRRKPTQLSRSISSPSKEVEEWKRPGEDAPDLEKYEEEVKILSPRRRQWSNKGAASSGLKEDLANNGSLESVIQLGNELLEELSSADLDEIAYREEQALFWYEKAAERGSLEAKSLIQQMVHRNSTGINASNRSSLRETLTLSDEELSGKRIGYLLYHSCAENDGSTILAGSLVGQSKISSELLTRQELIQCGKEYMKGRLVPEIDGKLISAESPGTSLSSLLNKYTLLVYIIHSLVSAFICKNVYLYLMILVVMHQYWIFISSTFVLQGVVTLLFLDTSLRLIHRPLEKRRFDAWTNLWEKYSSSKSGITQTELRRARKNFVHVRAVRFAFTTSLSIGAAEYLWGAHHHMTTAFIMTLIPLTFLCESMWSNFLFTLLSASFCVYFDPLSSQWMEEFQLEFILSAGIVVFVLWWKTDSRVLPQVLLLKVLDLLICSSHFHIFSTGLALSLSFYYGLKTFRSGALTIVSVLVGVFCIAYAPQFFPMEISPSNDLTLQKYTSLCPYQYDCNKVEGLKVKWTDLEVVSVKQRLHRHPLNKILMAVPQLQESLFHDLDIRYCDLGLIQGRKEDIDEPLGDMDDKVLPEEGLFSFSFGSPSTQKNRPSELHRKTIRARIWNAELCKSLREGSSLDILGVTSSMTSDVDVITYS